MEETQGCSESPAMIGDFIFKHAHHAIAKRGRALSEKPSSKHKHVNQQHQALTDRDVKKTFMALSILDAQCYQIDSIAPRRKGSKSLQTDDSACPHRLLRF